MCAVLVVVSASVVVTASGSEGTCHACTFRATVCLTSPACAKHLRALPDLHETVCC